MFQCARAFSSVCSRKAVLPPNAKILVLLIQIDQAPHTNNDLTHDRMTSLISRPSSLTEIRMKRSSSNRKLVRTKYLDLNDRTWVWCAKFKIKIKETLKRVCFIVKALSVNCKL